MATRVDWGKYGLRIADNEFCSVNGNMCDIDAIIAELSEIYENYSTHSMNEHVLWLKGGKEMLGKIIEYFKKVRGFRWG